MTFGGPAGAERGQVRAWGWVRHLRTGGTTPWSGWPGTDAEHDAADGAGGPTLPGAQQLELLRHLNRAAALGPATGSGEGVPEALVQRVLTASAPGRGRPDFQLVGAVPEPRFGPGLVDPGGLPLDELVRVATGLLAEDLVTRAADLPDPRVDRDGRHRDVPHRPRRLRRWRTAYLLGGDPWLADPARHHLVAQGRPPGGRDAVAVLVGTDLAEMLVDTWTARCFGDGAPPWREFLAGLVRDGRLPPRADLAGAAARWSGRLGPQRVAIVLDPARLPRLVGVRRPLPRRPALAAHATELARQVGPGLGLLVTPPRSAQLLTELLLPRLSEVRGDGLVLPAGRVRWVRRQALRQREALLAGGYPVHGDLDQLLPVGHTGVSEPSVEAVLDLALRLLLEAGDPTPPTPKPTARPTTPPVTQETR